MTEKQRLEEQQKVTLNTEEINAAIMDFILARMDPNVDEGDAELALGIKIFDAHPGSLYRALSQIDAQDDDTFSVLINNVIGPIYETFRNDSEPLRQSVLRAICDRYNTPNDFRSFFGTISSTELMLDLIVMYKMRFFNDVEDQEGKQPKSEGHHEPLPKDVFNDKLRINNENRAALLDCALSEKGAFPDFRYDAIVTICASCETPEELLDILQSFDVPNVMFGSNAESVVDIKKAIILAVLNTYVDYDFTVGLHELACRTDSKLQPIITEHVRKFLRTRSSIDQILSKAA